jgi:predicted DNA-binding protein (UPF0251 family)
MTKRNIDVRTIRSHPKVRGLPKEDQDIVEEFAQVLLKHRSLGALRLYDLIHLALTNWAEYEYYPKQRVSKKGK